MKERRKKKPPPTPNNDAIIPTKKLKNVNTRKDRIGLSEIIKRGVISKMFI
ncbi:MAG: hypothetical protein OEZ22_07910 [Spirochaetia bacterium]|nr:hypothetical protein [Spirochaetia bacterium]